MGFATGFALVAVFVGFFGLMVVFRNSLLPPSAPPARTIPPVHQATSPAAPAQPHNGSTPAAEAPELELPAHEEEEFPELPPHESNPPTT